MEMNSMLKTDAYKIGHPFQYPKGTVLVYSNLTPRKSRIPGVDKMVVFGLQYFFQAYLIDDFNKNFFHRPKDQVMSEYEHRINTMLGGITSYKHIEDLHDLGYLPIEIKALPEGSTVEMRVPILTIKNTLPQFYWVTNFLETIMSATIWQACTSATIAHEYRKLLNKYGKLTGMPDEFIQWQGHDFSMRGMSSFESSILSGMAHLLSFTGTDTIPAIDALEEYYEADSGSELIGGSVAATEHSVMSSNILVDGDEFLTFKRLITEIYPTGIVSIVSDTFNLWEVIKPGGYMDRLKPEILARNGKVVIRPDSGDPVKIITGYTPAEWTYSDKTITDSHGTILNYDYPEAKGVIECLWDIFGGTITSTGHKLLDSHVGAIYGDSITLERADQICFRLMTKEFASQCVFGIGSFTYQYNTRDTFGIAMKATYIEIEEDEIVSDGHHGHYGFVTKNKRGIEIFKDPITDDGTKKSARGLVKVEEYVKGDQQRGIFKHDRYVLVDQVNWEEEEGGALKTVFLDGKITHTTSLSEIRKRLSSF